MASKRFKDVEWSFPTTTNGGITEWQHVQVAVLMDIRDELKALNQLLRCPNFTGMPHQLSRLARDTAGLRRDLKKSKKLTAKNAENTKH